MLNKRSKQIRRDTIALSKANGGYHYGGSFSAVELLVALYDHVLTVHDKFILSKGHACWPYYVLLREQGYDPRPTGHPERDVHNGIHWTTGSEGHGFPAAIGMAIAKKMMKKPGKVYVIVGDGECQEGTTWESLLLAAHHKLDNLVIMADWNGIQGSGYTKDILPIPNFDKIAELIGWNTSVIDGHSCEEILEALSVFEKDTPRLIIANTVKGKGVSYMENQPCWHAQWPPPDREKQALQELEDPE